MTGVAAVCICFVFHFVYVFTLPIVGVNILVVQQYWRWWCFFRRL